jgi:Sulfotransferase domain
MGAMATAAYRRLMKRYQDHRTDCFVVSHPKCGRTWLRVMLAKALALHFRLPHDAFTWLSDVFAVRAPGVPRIHFTHDGANDPLRQGPFSARCRRYRGKKVVFLARDPRDVMVSYYFQRTRREHRQGELSQLIRDPVWGVDRLIEFMNEWYVGRDVPRAFLLVRYEDLHWDAPAELRKILAFLGLSEVAHTTLQEASEYASFGNMRRLATSELSHVTMLAPVDPGDPESHKIRQGRVGGYRDYLAASDVEYLETRIRERLHPAFGYE